jgi:hypothetical protein
VTILLPESKPLRETLSQLFDHSSPGFGITCLTFAIDDHTLGLNGLLAIVYTKESK